MTALLAVLAGSVVLTGGVAAAENATFTPHDENATFLPETNQTVSGNTTLDAGTTVQVYLQSSGEGQVQFIKTATTNVTDEGTYEASFNFSSMPNGSGGPVTVTVRAQSESNASVEYERRFVDSTPFDPRDENRTLEAGSNATLSGYATYDEGTELTVRVQAADENATQYLKQTTTNVTANGTYAATFDLRNVTNATDSVAVTVARANGSDNESYEYELPVRSVTNETTTENGTTTPLLTATETETPVTETPTETAAPTTEPETDEPTSETGATTEPETETTTPGFGVGTAVVAFVSLVVAVALARRP
ncbi:hypothetical protein DWB78_04395 [Halopelagius longus]|uniref:PGF-CTERM sorting domain-containing protein n=1 Tax=Halopelagius longus TaxID=1236180 RepID=A0A370IK14_9EURY|nr:hypothetical protein DWB78_04395 [Halopelagius longus]